MVSNEAISNKLILTHKFRRRISKIFENLPKRVQTKMKFFVLILFETDEEVNSHFGKYDACEF